MFKKGSLVGSVIGGAVLLAAGSIWAQPQIVATGSGLPLSATTSGGVHYVGGSGVAPGGASRWTLNGNALAFTGLGGTGGGQMSTDGQFIAAVELNAAPQVISNTATNVSPPFSMNPTLVPVPLAATEGRGARWNGSSSTFQTLGGLPIVPSLMVYGSGSSGSSTGNFQTPNGISQNGRFLVGLGYISTYNSAAGTTISNNTFQWRPWIWDAAANDGQGAFTVLPTPFRTSSNTWRRRTGNAYAVSNDGLVIVGAQEHNVSGQPAADPDGGRPVVWRWDSGISEYVMTYLPNGVNGSGHPYTYSTTPGTFHINAAGTIIVGRAVDNAGTVLYIAKWLWNEGTQSWDAPISIGTVPASAASWLPGSVTGCGVPPNLTPTGMSDDGNTIVGQAVYSTCGSFMSGGWIWTAGSNTITDWYDYLSEAAGPTIFSNYGPIGDQGDPNRGLPKLGYPTSISTDGNLIVGFQGGTQRIAGAPSWLVINSGGPGCVPAVITQNPPATVNYSACSTSIVMSTFVAGTLPVSYQWYKNAEPLVDGGSASGSVIVGANAFLLRVDPMLSTADAGAYHAVVSSECGKPISTTTATVQVDPAFPIATNDVCATAEIVSAGTNVLNPAQSPCGALNNDPIGGASCYIGATRADRWYVFTPATDGDYRIETCGSSFDTVLTVFSNCDGAEIACNDNYTSGPSTGCPANRSRILSLQMTAGLPYYIRIAAPLTGNINALSTTNLSIIGAPVPAPNDNCFTATAAVVGANNFSTDEATPDTIVSCNTAVFARDVWFSYTATNPGTVRLATCPGTSWNTVLSVYDACGGSELACNDNAGITGCTNQSVISDLAMTANQTIYIRIGTNSDTNLGGVGVLTVEFTIDCRADFNNDGTVNSQDFFDFLTPFFNQDPSSDFNGDTFLNSQDFFDFLVAFFAGC